MATGSGTMPISRPAVSRHLRLLKQAGLVVEEPRGTRAGSTGSTMRVSLPCAPTSSGSGARRRHGSGSSRRAPPLRPASSRRLRQDRAEPIEIGIRFVPVERSRTRDEIADSAG
jgi:hypothetical protein